MKKRVITFHYTLKNAVGDTLDSSQGQEPMEYLEGSEALIPGLIPVLESMKAGETKAVTITPEQGYGERDEKLKTKVPKSQLPTPEVAVGDHFQVSMGGDERIVLVAEINGDEVTMDGNHPLAGMTLHFDLEVSAVRDATDEEIAHGHAHGAHGHHHH